MTHLIDITRTVQDAPVYPGDEPTCIRRLCDLSDGGAYNFSRITTNSHAGTHADAYTHYLADSDGSIDRMPLGRYYGSCRVVRVPADMQLTVSDLSGCVEGIERLVLHGGGNSVLTADAARYLIRCGVKTLVTDAMSVSAPAHDAEVHRILLGAGAAIVENVILDGVPEGDYTLCAFPVKYGGCDGAPVRAVLIAG